VFAPGRKINEIALLDVALEAGKRHPAAAFEDQVRLFRFVRARFEDDVRRNIKHDQPHVLGRRFGIDRVDDPHAQPMTARIDHRDPVLNGHDPGVHRLLRLGDARRLVALIALEDGNLGHAFSP